MKPMLRLTARPTPFILLIVACCAVRAQDSQSKRSEPIEPTVNSLSDVKPGMSRAAVLAGLADGYLLSKVPAPEAVASQGVESWVVTSKDPPYRSATVNFIQGKTVSVQYSLFTSDSPEVAKFVQALQSAIYDSANVPTPDMALAQAQEDRKRHAGIGAVITNQQLDAMAKVNLEMWKLMNQRFALAGIMASQSRNNGGDIKEFTIQLGLGDPGQRNFQVQLLSVGGRTTVQLTEVRQ